jgi:hypothetical protein
MTESFLTTYVSLFEQELGESQVVDEVEIPLIQRDFAQGRRDPATTVVRDNFLDVLHAAATGAEPVGLDFVYGEVMDGKLRPLDGQQRLTVLFLLHWYLAARTNRVDEANRWARFSYATRPSARLFCQRLAAATLPADIASPSRWIADQPWYLSTWRYDPTVRSMLVVVDAIHQRFADDDLDEAWKRLTDPDDPAISFHLLPIENMGSPEDLYIKMNSRGRPLTEFENFKAQFEKAIEGQARADEFAEKVDGAWSDLLWPMHGGDNLIDDEFLKYLQFAIELCEWRQGETASRGRRLIVRAETVFNPDQPAGAENVGFLFHAFDTWTGEPDVSAYFDGVFTTVPAVDQNGCPKLVLFGQDVRKNLLEACCREFGNEQKFGTTRKILLYAILLHRRYETADFPRRLRSLRNLLEASEDELRAHRMPKIVNDTYRLIVDGDLAGVEALNQVQRTDEVEKWAFVEQHPNLLESICRLEDDSLLRGSLVAFDLNAERFDQRATAFRQSLSTQPVVRAFTGALLASGVYQRKIRASLKFGAPERSNRWRDLLTGATRQEMSPTRAAMARVLDVLSETEKDPTATLQAIGAEFTQGAEDATHLDWRYYLVKYPVMRTGRSGIYRAPNDSMGYSLCMLEKAQLNSYYRDPYLLAIVREAGLQASVVDGGDGPWFTGAATNPRWLRLHNSDLQFRCVPEGFAVKAPPEDDHRATLEVLVGNRSDISETEAGYLLAVPQAEAYGRLVDTSDRIAIGAGFLQAAVEAGL